MAHTYEELKKKSVAELREIAKDVQHDAVKGYTQLNKEHLLKSLCTALNIDTHAHHEVVGIDKFGIKAKIKAAKKSRDQANEAHDEKALKRARYNIHRLKRELRKAII
jgi:hypothetical protein